MIEADEHYILVSNPKNHEDYGEKIVLMVVTFGACLPLFFFGFSHEPYFELWLVIAGLICLIIGLITLKNVLNLTTLKIGRTVILVKSIIGKPIVINRQDLISFHERHLEEKSKNRVYKWNELVFFTKEDHITVSSKIHPDYNKIKLILTKDLPDFFNGPLYRKKGKIERKKLGALKLFVWGLLCISFPILKFLYIKRIASDINYDQLMEIKGVVKVYPETLTSSKPRKDIGLKFELKEYPDFEFKVYESYFMFNDYSDFRSSVYMNKEVILYISLDEYRKKISKESPIKFNDKYFDFNSIRVFGAKVNDRQMRRIKIASGNDPGQIEFNYLNSAIMYLLVGLFALFMYLGTQRWREYKDLLIEEEEI